MKILAFDTSTRALSVAVADGRKIIRYRNLRTMKFLSSSIVPAIEGILKTSKVSLKEIEGLIIGLGPGSFTSLRVGIATAKALAFANGIPAVGVASLDAIALNVKADGRVLVMNDARRGLVYARSYEKKGTSLKPLTESLLENPEQVIKAVSPGTIMIGDAISLYKPLLKPFSEIIEDPSSCYPDARHLITLGADALSKAKGSEINPIYLYPEDCQVSKK